MGSGRGWGVESPQRREQSRDGGVEWRVRLRSRGGSGSEEGWLVGGILGWKGGGNRQ